jgi:hypothetical protein
MKQVFKLDKTYIFNFIINFQMGRWTKSDVDDIRLLKVLVNVLFSFCLLCVSYGHELLF